MTDTNDNDDGEWDQEAYSKLSRALREEFAFGIRRVQARSPEYATAETFNAATVDAILTLAICIACQNCDITPSCLVMRFGQLMSRQLDPQDEDEDEKEPA